MSTNHFLGEATVWGVYVCMEPDQFRTTVPIRTPTANRFELLLTSTWVFGDHFDFLLTSKLEILGMPRQQTKNTSRSFFISMG